MRTNIIKSFDFSFNTIIGSNGIDKGDSFIHKNKLFVVIDGVGGNYLGKKATELASRVLQEAFFAHLQENDSPSDAIIYALKEANRVILSERIKLGEKMAASVSIMYIKDNIMYFSHLGDSRIYSFHDNELNQLTRDHTLKEEDPFAEKRFNDPRALQALTNGLGIHERPSIYVKKYPLDKKGMIILTTERLTERISNREIDWLAKKYNNPKTLIRSLEDLFRRKGGDDTCTVGIVRFGILSRWIRHVIFIYSVVLMFILIFVGVYLLRYSDDKVSDNAEGTMPHVEGKIAVIESRPETEVKPVVKTENKTEVRKPIIIEKPAEVYDRKPPEVKKEIEYDLNDQIYSFLSEWKDAWEKSAGRDGDIIEYLNFYSEHFKSGRFDKSRWKKDKSLKNKRKSWIKIGISDVRITGPDRDNRVAVNFTQDYRSSNYSVRSEKELVLIRENGTWVIVLEKSS